MLLKIKLHWPLVFIFLVWGIFISPYLLHGNVPFPASYQVNHFPPWSLLPSNWSPVRNGAMPDIIDQIYPWKHLVIEQWKNGIVPLWNPYNFSGNPLLANFQSAVFSPFNLLFFILPFINAWSMLIILQPLLAGLFTYFFLRSIQISKAGSVVSATTFMFCGFVTVWMAYGTLVYAILFLPLALFAIEKYFETKKYKFLVLLTATFPLSFFSGHFQTSVYFAIYTSCYLFYSIIFERNKLASFYSVLALICGVFISFPQLLPSVELYNYAVRSISYNIGGGIPLKYFVTVFSPDFYGNPVTKNDWYGTYAEWSSFVGIIPLIFGLFAFRKFNKKPFNFFIAATIVFLVLALETPLAGIIGALKIPVLSTSNPTRIIVLFSFSWAILVGIGLDALRENFKNKLMYIFGVFTILFLIIFTTWFSLLVGHLLPVDKAIIAKRNLILPSVLLLVTFLIIIFTHIKKNKIIAQLSFFIILVLVSFDSLRFVTKWMPFENKKLVFPSLPVIAAMQKNISTGRYLGNLGAQVASFYDLQGVEGYDPLYIKRYGEFLDSIVDGTYREAERSVAHLGKTFANTDRVIDLLGVKLIYQPSVDTYQGWAYPVWDKKDRVEKIYQDEMFQIYSNKTGFDKATLFYDYEVISNDKKILKRLYSNDFNFRQKLILEEKIFVNFKPGKGSVRAVSYKSSKIDLNVSTDSNALLFMPDNFYPGWEAYVDGQSTKIYRTDYTFRSIIVPKGSHHVQFLYKPKSFAYGVYVAIIGVIGIVMLGLKIKDERLKIKPKIKV